MLYSSRRINPQTGQYELDSTTGGVAMMTSIAQRVLLLVSYADQRTSLITDQDNAEVRQRIMLALEPMAGGVKPEIQLLGVEVGSDSAGTTYRRVRYRNLTTGLDESVQA